MATPRHAQVADELRDLIDDGTFPPGSKLPAEMRLAERFGVNRLTVRQALGQLASAGVVRSRQGLGTFVEPRRHPFVVEMSPSDWQVEAERASRVAASQGRPMVEELLDVRTVEAPDDVAAHLGRGAMLWLESVHRVNAEPLCRNEYWTRSAMSPHDVRSLNAAHGLDFGAIRTIVGADMFYAWRLMDAVAATRRDASVLALPQGFPMLRRTGLNCDAVGRPLLYLQRDVPGGRMQIMMRSRPPGDA